MTDTASNPNISNEEEIKQAIVEDLYQEMVTSTSTKVENVRASELTMAEQVANVVTKPELSRMLHMLDALRSKKENAIGSAERALSDYEEEVRRNVNRMKAEIDKLYRELKVINAKRLANRAAIRTLEDEEE